MSYFSSDYPGMCPSIKDRSSHSLSHRQYDQLIVFFCGRGGVGPRTTHLSSKKVYFVRYRHDVGFRPSWSHFTGSPVESSFGKDYSAGSAGGYSFSVT